MKRTLALTVAGFALVGALAGCGPRADRAGRADTGATQEQSTPAARPSQGAPVDARSVDSDLDSVDNLLADVDSDLGAVDRSPEDAD